MTTTTDNLYSRQLGLIPPEKLQRPITIIGAGSIGSWTTLCLSKMGCTALEVWDMDETEPHNSPNQLYGPNHTGKKAEQLSDIMTFLSHNLIQGLTYKYEGEVVVTDIIISAVDNMEARKKIFETHRGMPKWLIDGRMGGNAIEIYAVPLEDAPKCDDYAKTLFTDQEGNDVPCSERSVAYNGLIIGGYISSLVAKIVLEKEVPSELIIDIENYLQFKTE